MSTASVPQHWLSPIAMQSRSATELQMSPVTAPGSVIFTLLAEPPGASEGPTGPGTAPSLLDESIAELLRIFDEVSDDSLSEQEIARQIRIVGPRAAKHLQSLSDLIVSDDISMELTLGPGTEHRRIASFDRRSAAFLKEIIKSNAIDVSEETLEGTLGGHRYAEAFLLGEKPRPMTFCTSN